MNRIPSLLVIGALALLATSAGAQEGAGAPSPKPEKKSKPPKIAKPAKEKPWQPNTVPIGVLLFGQKLEDGAPGPAKDWFWDYVKSHLRDKDLVPKEVIDSVDQRYASASTVSRDLGIYLVYYLAQKDDDENQRMLSYRIRDIDRETYDIGRQLNVLWESEQNRFASLQQSSLTAEERVRREQLEQKLNARLRELGDERQLKATQVAFSRKKMNAYLKLMEYAYPKLKDESPALLKELQ